VHEYFGIFEGDSSSVMSSSEGRCFFEADRGGYCEERDKFANAALSEDVRMDPVPTLASPESILAATESADTDDSEQEETSRYDRFELVPLSSAQLPSEPEC
jgi:hypothetical protein